MFLLETSDVHAVWAERHRSKVGAAARGLAVSAREGAPSPSREVSVALQSRSRAVRQARSGEGKGKKRSANWKGKLILLFVENTALYLENLKECRNKLSERLSKFGRIIGECT